MALQALLADWRNTCTSLQVVHPTAVKPDALDVVRAIIYSPEFPEDSDIIRIGGPCAPALLPPLVAHTEHKHDATPFCMRVSTYVQILPAAH